MSPSALNSCLEGYRLRGLLNTEFDSHLIIVVLGVNYSRIIISRIARMGFFLSILDSHQISPGPKQTEAPSRIAKIKNVCKKSLSGVTLQLIIDIDSVAEAAFLLLHLKSHRHRMFVK